MFNSSLQGFIFPIFLLIISWLHCRFFLSCFFEIITLLNFLLYLFFSSLIKKLLIKAWLLRFLLLIGCLLILFFELFPKVISLILIPLNWILLSTFLYLFELINPFLYNSFLELYLEMFWLLLIFLLILLTSINKFFHW